MEAPPRLAGRAVSGSLVVLLPHCHGEDLRSEEAPRSVELWILRTAASSKDQRHFPQNHPAAHPGGRGRHTVENRKCLLLNARRSAIRASGSRRPSGICKFLTRHNTPANLPPVTFPWNGEVMAGERVGERKPRDHPRQHVTTEILPFYQWIVLGGRGERNPAGGGVSTKVYALLRSCFLHALQIKQKELSTAVLQYDQVSTDALVRRLCVPHVRD
mmetsp:Transcript_34091/g.70402  ORF Transcript_34091/g.70402 Transcript_34091/m.70402 type:complete len:216 (-) Transcript_34091:275-922(-)